MSEDCGVASSMWVGLFFIHQSKPAMDQQRRRLNARMASDVLLYRRFEQLVAKLND